MEITESPSWLISQHPNYKRWKKAREISLERGKFVKMIISRFIKCESLNILELGSGEGGTADVFSKDNQLVSVDLSFLRLQRQPNGINRINADALKLPFKESSFDLIILQDVLEHISFNNDILHYLSQFLQKEGFVYISTPNRFSLINFIADPHFGLPCISLFKRDQIKKYFLPIFRKEDFYRKDIAQLLSLSELIKMSTDYDIFLNTKLSVSELLYGNKGVAWSDLHLKLVGLIKRLGLENFIFNIADDRDSFLNRFFTPTFYLILKRK
jgi:SAM-dependent methyltransferase